MLVWGVLAVEPPALAGKKNGAEKSEPANRLFFFLISSPPPPPSPKRCQDHGYPIGKKQNVNRNDRKLHEEVCTELLQNIVMEKREKSRNKNRESS